MRCLDRLRPAELPLLTALVAMILALAGPSDAQVLYGSLVGNVADTSQGALGNATVILIHQQTNLARETTTSGDGRYRFGNLQPGDYTVRVVLEGFKEYVRSDVPVSVNAVARVDITLEVGSLTEAITVQSERMLLQTEAGDLKVEVKGEAIVRMPLGPFRNYQTLMNLVPGATPTQFQNVPHDTPARSLGTHVNGTPRDNNNTRLDGTTNVYIWLPRHALYVAPAETIHSVNISTANFDAEQGMAGGAAITVLTKSGTNEFHGSAFAFHENEGLQARNFFNPGEKIDSSRNIDGATLGGPIIKDKLFFFGAWEGHYLTQSDTRTGTVPTAAMRAGDFSAFGTTIYDPLTGNPDGSGRTPFPNNVIPADRIDPIAAQLQARLPLPNLPGTAGNYTDTGPVKLTRNNFDFKLNWNISSSTQVWAKYSQMNALVYSDMWLGNPPDGGAGGNGFGTGVGEGDTTVRLGTFGVTWTVSPTFVIDGTVGATRFDQEVIPPDYGVNYGTDVLGIPGTNGQGGAFGDERYSGMPRFSISSFEAFGGAGTWTPLFRNDRSYNVSVNSTYIKGRHEMRFGVDVVRLELNHWQPELGDPKGRFDFNGGATAQGPTGSPNQVNAYAQFLLGYTTSTSKSLQYEIMTGREWQYGLYFRDRWQVSRNLTLNLGLRFEHYPLMKRADRGIEYYDDTTNQVLLGGLGGNPEDLGIEVKHPHFLPRVGFAYRLSENAVLRGGYGMTVSPMPFSRPLRGFYPLTIAETSVGPNPYVPFGTLEEGIPLFYGPDLSAGSVELPRPAGMVSPYADHVNRGYIQSWNLTYERRLPWDISLAAGYVGTQTTHQLGPYNINAAGAGEGWAGAPLFQRFRRTANTGRFDGWLSGNYHSLQVSLSKPFSRGLFLKAAYTWSRAMNRSDSDGWASVMWNHPSVLDRNYAQAGYNLPHMFRLGFVAELPFGRDGSGVWNAIVKDWVLASSFGAFSGRPFTVFASGASVNAPGNSQTADQVGDINKTGGIGSANPYYDTSAWAPVREVRFGTSGRNSVRGPGQWGINMSLFRRFPIGKKVTLEARVVARNLTNTPHFNNPNNNVHSSGFMTITSAAEDQRQIQLGLRLSF